MNTALLRLAGGRLLHGLEGNHRELVVKERLQLAVAGNREIALRLNDQEAGGHADLEPSLLGVQALLGELACQGRGRFCSSLNAEFRTWRTAVSSVLRRRAADWSRSSRARARLASAVLLPSG